MHYHETSTKLTIVTLTIVYLKLRTLCKYYEYVKQFSRSFVGNDFFVKDPPLYIRVLYATSTPTTKQCSLRHPNIDYHMQFPVKYVNPEFLL